MSGPVRCFFLTPTDRYQVDLRRYSASDGGRNCPLPRGYHDARVVLGVEQHAEHPVSRGDAVPHEDPRWPAACACGFVFAPEDHWQVNYEALHTRSDGGPECTLRDAPAGGMWDAQWWPDKHPDGRSLVVRLPDGSDWPIDGPSHNADHTLQAAQGWTRTGEPPAITASPSILIHRTGYHAWLRDGVLVPC